MQPLTVITLNGLGGLTAARLVEEAHKHDQEPAPVHLQRMVEGTARNWDQLTRLKNATQILAVSFFYNKMRGTSYFADKVG